jgi:hypothetical protein
MVPQASALVVLPRWQTGAFTLGLPHPVTFRLTEPLTNTDGWAEPDTANFAASAGIVAPEPLENQADAVVDPSSWVHGPKYTLSPAAVQCPAVMA